MSDILTTISNNAKDLSSQIGKWQEVINAYYKQIDDLKVFLNSSDLLVTAWAEALEACLQEAKWILVNEVNIALESVEEYNHPIFISDLLEACVNPETLSLGYADGQYIVNVDLNKTAGYIEQYARAVSATREILNDRKVKGPKSAPGDLASRMWFEKVYGPDRSGKSVPRRKGNPKTRLYEWIDVTENYVGKYFETMELRKSFFISGQKAPWWYLLDHGNSGLKSVFPRSPSTGYAAPSNPPTHFVDKAKRKIEVFCVNKHGVFITNLKNLTTELINRLYVEVVEAEKVIEEIIAILDDTVRLKAIEVELTRTLIERGKEHLLHDRKFKLAIEAIRIGRSSIRHGFYFSSGERLRLKSVANNVKEALRTL